MADMLGAADPTFYANAVAQAFNRSQVVRYDAGGSIRMASDKTIRAVPEGVQALAGAGADEILRSLIGRGPVVAG